MATYATINAWKNKTAKNMTGGVYSVVETLEIGTDYLVNTSTGASAVTTPGIGDVVQMVALQAGTTVLDGYIVVDNITASDIDVGYGDNTDQFVDAADSTTPGKKQFTNEEAFVLKLSADDTIDVKFNTVAPTAGTLQIVLFCTTDEVDAT